MAIIDTLTTIKDYFMHWHEKYYNQIHKETIDDLNDEIENRIDGDANLLNKITYPNFLASQVRDTTRNPPDGQSVQTTLDQYGNKLNTYANAGTRTLKSDSTVHPDGADHRGFYHEMSDNQNGLMTWQDKAVLRYTGEWIELTHDDWPSIHGALKIWVNPTLRIVYCNFDYPNCTWLKNDKYNVSTYGASKNTAWFHIRPISSIWVPTNVVGVQFAVGSDACLYLRSDRTIAKGHFFASTFWFYRDNNMYQKLMNKKG